MYPEPVDALQKTEDAFGCGCDRPIDGNMAGMDHWEVSF